MCNVVHVITAVELTLLVHLGQGPIAEIGAADQAPDIEAKAWFNPQPVRLFERPAVALVHFWSVRSAEEPKFVKVLNRLQER